jgi:hypothetical protein
VSATVERLLVLVPSSTLSVARPYGLISLLTLVVAAIRRLVSTILSAYTKAKLPIFRSLNNDDGVSDTRVVVNDAIGLNVVVREALLVVPPLSANRRFLTNAPVSQGSVLR